jgi:ribosomal protein L13E
LWIIVQIGVDWRRKNSKDSLFEMLRQCTHKIGGTTATSFRIQT